MAISVPSFDTKFGLTVENAYVRVVSPALEKVNVEVTPAVWGEVDGQPQLVSPSVYEPLLHVVYDVVVHADEQARAEGLRPVHEERRQRVLYPDSEPNPFSVAYGHLKGRDVFSGAEDC